RYRGLARRAGARVEEGAMVTGWSPAGELEVTSPAGRRALSPSVVVLSTGCRERTRAARLVAGSRPAGVLTTGMLQQLVELRGGQPDSWSRAGRRRRAERPPRRGRGGALAIRCGSMAVGRGPDHLRAAARVDLAQRRRARAGRSPAKTLSAALERLPAPSAHR